MIIYQILSVVFSPLIDFYLLIRKWRSKEDSKRIKERFGFAGVKRPRGEIVWIHAASIGESNSALPLINFLLDKNPHIHILFTSGTVTSAAEIAKKATNPRVIHQFIPVDKLSSTRRFIKYWQPNYGVFIESEIWPNLIYQAHKSGCQLALVNGRVSQSSYQRWQLLHKIGFNIFQYFNVIIAQSRNDLKRFAKLGIKQVFYYGNIKSITPILKTDQSKLEQIRTMIGHRTTWLASNIHSQEQQIILKTHQNLKNIFPDLLTIIVPRHPTKVTEIVTLTEPNKIAVRSQNQLIHKETEIYLADTLGEMGIFYQLSAVSLIGGSLVDKIGGHNPFEAISCNSMVLTGRFVANNQEIYQELLTNNSCIMIEDNQKIAEKVATLLQDSAKRLNIISNAKKLLATQDQILNKIVEKIFSLKS